MEDLKTGTLFIKAKQLEETNEHISRLSIRCMLNGRQHYKVGGCDRVVTPENYLVVNQGQRYQTSFASDTEQEMILVAFRPGFAEGLYHTFVTPEEDLLTDPFTSMTRPLHFFEQTYEQDPVISKLFTRLRILINTPGAIKEEADLDKIYTTLLQRLLSVHSDLDKQVSRLGSVKEATRRELYRRLNIARDYMEANLSSPIGLEEIATSACLSVHHFKRSFKTLFSVTPHEYLIQKRLQKAHAMLTGTTIPVADVAASSGFLNASAFIRAFRTYYGATPGQLRFSAK